jgi:glycosyltransferase involved in cell wall biosynthesis
LILICAYNEERTLPSLLGAVKGKQVLLIDDGSEDKTREIATNYGVTVISHEKRLGKAISLADGISYALQNSYGTIVEIDGDSVPKSGTIQKVLDRLSKEKNVGAVTCRQVPIGAYTLAYHLDELIWAILTEGKRVQMRTFGSCHLGSVLVAFRTELVDSVEGSVNDDEQVGISIEKKGYRIAFEDKALVYFDASSCLGHILERRRRMYFGHMKFAKSTAPSMNIRTSTIATLRALSEDKRRSVWVLPTIALDLFARFLAWKDVRRPDKSKKYSRWVTTYAKDNSLVIRNSPAQ